MNHHALPIEANGDTASALMVSGALAKAGRTGLAIG